MDIKTLEKKLNRCSVIGISFISMNLYFSDPLKTIEELANKELAGYNAEEIKKIEFLYDIIVDGDFKKFMELAGKCSGGVIGDQDMLLYRENMNLRNHLLYQEDFRDELREYLGCVDIAQMKPFIFAVAGETQIYLLKTAAEDSNIVYHYDQNHDTFGKTEWHFWDYLRQQISNTIKLKKHYGDRGVCKGHLLRICQNKYI